MFDFEVPYPELKLFKIANGTDYEVLISNDIRIWDENQIFSSHSTTLMLRCNI